jgi:MYXO-CTERM domain-containing protein
VSRAGIAGTAGWMTGREGRGVRARLGLSLVLATLGSWALATPAHAYVRYQIIKNGALSGVFEQWKQTCIPLVVYPTDLANEMTMDEVVGAATAAADAWSQADISGTYLDVQMTTSLDATPATGQDAYHDIIFKNPWCDPGDTSCQLEALAITSVWAGQTSGTIVDADIEVNAQYDVWTDLVAHPATGKQDLQNALTHEMGHLIGLDHNCYTPGSDPVHMVDNTGKLVPSCLGADAEIQNDVMFTKADPGDISKRTLKPDDIQAVLDIYPTAKNPHACPAVGDAVKLPTTGGGCQCALDSTSGAAALVPALALLAVVALRRTRTRTRTR